MSFFVVTFFGNSCKTYTGKSLENQNSNNIGVDLNSFILVVFAGLLFENFLCQWLVINQTYLSYNGKYRKQLVIILSTILFGLIHFYSFYLENLQYLNNL